MMRIEAITLDVGGTLIDPWPSAGHVYAEVAAAHGHKNVSHELLNHQFVAAWRTRTSFDYTRSSWCEIVAATFQGLCSVHEVEQFFDPLYARFEQSDVWRVHPDVFPALMAMQKRGLRLAVISNWDDRLRGLLQRLQLAPYFESIVVSGEIGVHKPSPEIFQTALRALNLPADRVLHIGDHPREDIEGARAVGMHARRVVRNGNSDSADLRAIVEAL